MGIIKFIKDRHKAYKERQHQEWLAEKQKVTDRLKNPMSAKYVHNWNASMIVESAGWLGGDYEARDIKLHILRHNQQYFDDKEYDELLKIIMAS